MSNETDKLTDILNDVALERHSPDLAYALDEVGLQNVQTVVVVAGQKLKATVQASVSLDVPEAKGIHMSRLYKIVSQLANEELSWNWLQSRLGEMLNTHQTLSKNAALSVRLDLPVLRPALLSQESGWRAYPLIYNVTAKGSERRSTLQAKVLYSSTCPCSAALSQQALRDAFAGEFREEKLSREQILNWLASGDSVVAVPHAQRSEATCEFTFAKGQEPASPIELIDLMEGALGTAVQTAVKREDEQEFARLNARNLMFCEDAARKLKAALIGRKELADFQIEVRHFESLHAHDVVARVGKKN
jgi:GTP cyclohydrolase I